MSTVAPSHLTGEAASRIIYQQTEDVDENVPFKMTVVNDL